MAGQSWDVGTGDELSDLGMSDIFLGYLEVFMISLEISGDLGSECQGVGHKVSPIQQSCSMSQVDMSCISSVRSVIRSFLREGAAAGCTYALAARRQFRTRSLRQVAKAATVAMAPWDSQFW